MTYFFALIPFLALSMMSNASEPTHSERGVGVEMKNVVYHFTDTVDIQIRALSGELIPLKGDIPVFDDKESFTVQIGSAEIAISLASLSNVLNGYVFADHDAPLKALAISGANGEKLKIKGKLHNKGDIPFEMQGQLSVTNDGKIRLHAEKVKAVHLPVKGLMDLLGVTLAGLVHSGKIRGVVVDGDDVILDPETLLPPPHIAGKVTAVRVESGQIVQVFGHKTANGAKPAAAGNYMAYRGNRLRFGKLTMNDTDMVLIDMDPGDPFDFYLDHYKEQLVAGYTKETMDFGLRVYMRDYNKLKKRTSATSR